MFLRHFYCLGLFLFAGQANALPDEALLAKLREGGYVLMIRHAYAPGSYDPPDFRLADCSAQRNLSEEGRAEAVRLGAAFRRLNIPVSQVLSSAWCRCIETARLAFGDYQLAAMLNLVRSGSDEAKRQIEEMRVAGNRVRAGSNLVFVTHNFNIQPFSGRMVSTTDVVVLRPAAAGRLELVAIIEGLGKP